MGSNTEKNNIAILKVWYKYRVSTKCFLRGFRKNWFIFYMQKNLSIYLSIYLPICDSIARGSMSCQALALPPNCTIDLKIERIVYYDAVNLT